MAEKRRLRLAKARSVRTAPAPGLSICAAPASFDSVNTPLIHAKGNQSHAVLSAAEKRKLRLTKPRTVRPAAPQAVSSSPIDAKQQPKIETPTTSSTDSKCDVDIGEASTAETVAASNEHDSVVAESSESEVAPSEKLRSTGEEKDTKEEKRGEIDRAEGKSSLHKEMHPSGEAPAGKVPAQLVGQTATKTSASIPGGLETWRTFSIIVWAGVTGK